MPATSGNNLMNFPGFLTRTLPPESPGQLSNVSMSSLSTVDEMTTTWEAVSPPRMPFLDEDDEQNEPQGDVPDAPAA